MFQSINTFGRYLNAYAYFEIVTFQQHNIRNSWHLFTEVNLIEIFTHSNFHIKFLKIDLCKK